LEDLSDHTDCAFFLALHYVTEKRFDDAVLTLADVAIAIEPSWWVGLYTTAFDALNIQKVWRKLNPETRLVFHHAYGHCLSASGRLEDARGQYEKLRRAGNRRKDPEAVGLALLNIGVSYHKDSDFASATKWYERAREHGVKQQQPMLTSHALGNLGQIQVDFDPQNAIELLEQSIAYKKTEDDQVGIAGSLQVLAVAHAELNESEKAIEYYDLAESIAEDFNLRHLRSLLLNNKAHSLLQDGKRTEALRTFKKALKIVDAEGFSELRVRSTEEICRIHFLTRSLDDAETSMLDLLRLAKEAAFPEFEMTAHHGLWAVYSLKNDMKLATRHFASLTRLARKHKSYEWLVPALVDKSRSIDGDGFGAADPKKLQKLISAESRRNDALATESLWHALAQILADHDADTAVTSLLRCIECFSRDPDMIADVLDAHEYIYVLQWESGRFQEAIETLDTIARLAKVHRDGASDLAAIDQKGFCLQELDRLTEAMPLHARDAKRSKS
jgi:tetratricopeptide (TPR) repeat protein